jgi:hypothetical protein
MQQKDAQPITVFQVLATYVIYVSTFMPATGKKNGHYS